MAERFRQVIKDQFDTQIALARAIGVKDGSYLTPYVTGRSMIGGILRKKLEAVGIDVDYIMTGRKKELFLGEGGPEDSGANEIICEQCANKLIDIQSRLLALNAEILEVNKMVSQLKKSLK